MKRQQKLLLFWLALSMLLLPLSSCFKPSGDNNNGVDGKGLDSSVLILYDDKAPSLELRRSAQLALGDWDKFPYKDAGLVYAQMLANLLGGFEGLEYHIKGMSEYRSGEALKYKRSFYLGSTQNAPIPESFQKDVLSGAPVTWIGYNFEVLDQTAAFQTLGASYATVYENYQQDFRTGFSHILYKGYLYPKFQAARELIGVSLNDADVWAWAYTEQGEKSPYILKKDKFWYVADIPFTFITERDRYLVFADLLWDMLGLSASCAPQALLRFEDIRPFDETEDLNRVFSLVKERGIYFSLATVPVYVNITNGAYLNWSDNPSAISLIKDYQADGWAFIFQHGTTHHTDNMYNLEGISGADWEFWDAAKYGPLEKMNPALALKRVLVGKQLLYDAGLNPIGWITPHYAAPGDYLLEFNKAYELYFERRFVESGLLRTTQFFPYPVKDTLGASILPENANYVSEANTLKDILETAKVNRVLHCPYLGVFMHPYIFNPEYQGADKVSLEQLNSFLDELQALGYEFVRPTDVRRFNYRN
ncbi:MAG: DUF2334 domain-containing protein [Trueperaceae bacterium]|nr:DUF2334 domain-containing protein [Trueperaceae bacterium]